MREDKDTRFYQFCLPLLQRLHMNIDDFLEAVERERKYESQIYQWIEDLYDAEVSFDTSIKFLYHARNLFFLHGKMVNVPYKKKKISPVLFHKTSKDSTAYMLQ